MTIDPSADAALACRVPADGGLYTVATRSAEAIDPITPISQESHR